VTCMNGQHSDCMRYNKGCYPRYTNLVMSHTSTGLMLTLSFLGSGFGLRLSNGGGSMLGYLHSRMGNKAIDKMR